MILTEAKTLVELIGVAGGWLRTARQAAKKESDRRAAQALHDAGILVAATRTYDNAFRRIVIEAMSFSSNWPDDRRAKLSSELKEFVGQETILPHLRQARASLHCSDDDDFCDELTSLTRIADEFVQDIMLQIEHTKGLEMSLWRVIEAIEQSRPWEYEYPPDPGQQEVLAWAKRELRNLDRAKAYLAETDEAYGMLRRKILASHPLPEAGWAVSLV